MKKMISGLTNRPDFVRWKNCRYRYSTRYRTNTVILMKRLSITSNTCCTVQRRILFSRMGYIHLLVRGFDGSRRVVLRNARRYTNDAEPPTWTDCCNKIMFSQNFLIKYAKCIGRRCKGLQTNFYVCTSVFAILPMSR